MGITHIYGDNRKYSDIWIDELKDFFGKQWLEKELKKYPIRKPDGKSFNADDVIRSFNIHPVVHAIRGIRLELQKADVLDQDIMPVNNYMVYLDSIGETLYTLKGKYNVEKYKEKLKDINRFEGAYWELQVASCFIKFGYDIDFIDEGPKKTHDLSVLKGNSPLAIECKKKSYDTQYIKKYRSFSLQLEQKIQNILTYHKVNCVIIIRLKNKISFDSIKDISKRVNEIIENKIPQVLNINDVQIDIKFLNSNSYKHSELVNLVPPDTDSGFIKGDCCSDPKILYSDSPGKIFENPSVVSTTFPKERDTEPDYLSLLSSAKKQLPKNKPCVVFYNVPFKEFDTAKEEITKRLENSLHNISGIYLIAFDDTQTAQGYALTGIREAYIPQNSSNNPLPHKWKIIKSNKMFYNRYLLKYKNVN